MKNLLKVDIILMSLLLVTINLCAQAPDTLWTKSYRGTDVDECFSIQLI